MHACDMETPPHEGCRTCPLYSIGHYVPPTRNDQAQYLIVGEAPGEEEVARGVPFVGSSGKVLRSMLRSVGVDPVDVQFANAVSCRPPSNRTPSAAEIEACAPLLANVLSASDALVVAAVGRTALVHFLGVDRVSQIAAKGGSRSCWDQYVYRWGHEIPERSYQGRKYGRYGEFIEKGPNKGQRKKVFADAYVDVIKPRRARALVAVLHPAYVMRGWKELTSFGTALSRMVEVADSAPIYTGPENIITDPELFPTEGFDVLSFDIENDMVTGQITDISFASAGVVGSFKWSDSTAHLTKRLLTTGTYPLVAHNAGHDVRYLREAGIDVDITRVHDTMMMAYMDEPDLRKGLGHVAPRFMLCVPWKHQMGDNMTKYNAQDSDVTRRIYLELRNELREKDMWQHFVNVVMPSSFKLMEFTIRGIAVDPTKMHLWREELEEELLAANNRWVALTEKLTGAAVNYGSTKQLRELFFGTLKIPMKKTTKTGLAALDKDTIQKLMQRHPHEVFTLLLKLRELTKLVSTYVTNLNVHADSCIHPRYLPGNKDEGDFGAASGRPSARDPNIMNQPHSARYMYVPHRPGYVIFSRDYSQIEAVLVAIFAGDEDLMRAYVEGRDRHQETADYLTQALGRPVSRREAKSYRHGLNYGMGVNMLAEHAGVSIPTARMVVEAFKKLEPKVFAWQESVAREAARKGYIDNPFKRRRNFPGFADPKSKQKHVRNAAVNMRPQSTVADIILSVMTELDDALLAIDPHEDPRLAGACLLTEVHDEFVGQCRADLVDVVDETTKRIMERRFDNIKPGWYCKTSFSVGPSWAHCKDYDERTKKTGMTAVELWRADGSPVSEYDPRGTDPITWMRAEANMARKPGKAKYPRPMRNQPKLPFEEV